MRTRVFHLKPAEVAQAVEQRTENPLSTRFKMVRESRLIKDIQEIFKDDPRVNEVMKRAESRKRDRTPAPKAPEGGITLNRAGKKYGISPKTINRWARRDPPLVPILLETDNCLYVDEKALADLIERYNVLRGRGRRTALQTA